MSPLITKPKPGAMINPLHPLSKGLVGCWLFNEGYGNLANDISGRGNHGVLTNVSPNAQTSGWGSSIYGGGYISDGLNDQVEIKNSNHSGHSLDLLDDFSITAHVKIYTFGGYRTIVSKRGDIGYQYQFRFNGNDISLLTTGGSVNAMDSNLLINTDYFLTVTRDNDGDTVFYINGMYNDSEASKTIVYTDVDVNIGINDNGIHCLDGIIDTICIYNRVLQPKEVKQLNQEPFVNLLLPSISRYYVALTGGWTGIINGVTNPSHINGVAVANIAKANGVA